MECNFLSIESLKFFAKRGSQFRAGEIVQVPILSLAFTPANHGKHRGDANAAGNEVVVLGVSGQREIVAWRPDTERLPNLKAAVKKA
ncbi:hypothetical protein D9M68_641870 [compost metagenome]